MVHIFINVNVVILHACIQASWPPQKHCVESKSQVHKHFLANLMESHGVGAQDEHLILTPKDGQIKRVNLVI